MNDALAQRLLAKTMNWDRDKLTKERRDLQLLAEYKYNEYQQFEPGMRFIESLANWLEQFEESSRKTAYDFIKNSLIYISTAELNHLIRMTYPDFIKRHLLEQCAGELHVDSYKVCKITNSKEFKILERRCLFLGLSDGARIDALRRFSQLKHEQTHPTFSLDNNKAKDMLDKLQSDLKEMKADGNRKYGSIFLIDDFTASGLSYLRAKDDGSTDGKIEKCVHAIRRGSLQILCENDVNIYVVLYIATRKAKKHIKEMACKSGIVIKDVIVIAELDDSACMTEEGLNDFLRLAKEKLDETILTKHYKVGRHDKPHMGFDQCGLSVVLSHNCPNNSLPIIWHKSETEMDIRALFPRAQRHLGVTQ